MEFKGLLNILEVPENCYETPVSKVQKLNAVNFLKSYKKIITI